MCLIKREKKIYSQKGLIIRDRGSIIIKTLLLLIVTEVIIDD